MWDPRAKAVLVLTSSDSDPANKSYYGDAKLSFLAADGSSDAMVAIKVTSPARMQLAHVLSLCRYCDAVGTFVGCSRPGCGSEDDCYHNMLTNAGQPGSSRALPSHSSAIV